MGREPVKAGSFFNSEKWIDGATHYSGNNEGEHDFKRDMLGFRACEIVY